MQLKEERDYFITYLEEVYGKNVEIEHPVIWSHYVDPIVADEDKATEKETFAAKQKIYKSKQAKEIRDRIYGVQQKKIFKHKPVTLEQCRRYLDGQKNKPYEQRYEKTKPKRRILPEEMNWRDGVRMSSKCPNLSRQEKQRNPIYVERFNNLPSILGHKVK